MRSPTVPSEVVLQCKPGAYSAALPNGLQLVSSQCTELELRHELSRLGVILKDYNLVGSTGEEDQLTVSHWRRH